MLLEGDERGDSVVPVSVNHIDHVVDCHAESSHEDDCPSKSEYYNV